MRIRSDIPSRGGQSKRDTEGLNRWGPCIVPPSLRLRVHRLSHPVHERTHPNPRSHASSIPHRLDELPWHQQKGVSSGRPISHSRAGSPVQQHGPTGTGVSQESPSSGSWHSCQHGGRAVGSDSRYGSGPGSVTYCSSQHGSVLSTGERGPFPDRNQAHQDRARHPN